MDKTYFEQKKREIAEFRQKMKDEGGEFFKEISADIFTEYPDLISFGWTQYTPYFNDGDPCTFSARTDCPKIHVQGESEEDEDGEDFYSANDQSHRARVWRSVQGLLEQFDNDDMEMLFGDHCQVTVKRDGVEVEKYSHD